MNKFGQACAILGHNVTTLFEVALHFLENGAIPNSGQTHRPIVGNNMLTTRQLHIRCDEPNPNPLPLHQGILKTKPPRLNTWIHLAFWPSGFKLAAHGGAYLACLATIPTGSPRYPSRRDCRGRRKLARNLCANLTRRSEVVAPQGG